jgi:Cu/Ag efflux pump CusA
VLPHYAEQYLIRGVGLAKGVTTSGIVLKEVNGTPVYARVARVRSGTRCARARWSRMARPNPWAAS